MKVLQPECTKTARIKGSFPTGPFRTSPGEAYKRSPAVKFVIEEDGSVSNVQLARTSGLADLDKKVSNAVVGWKYKPRARGCGAIETEMDVLIHWR
jgi:TonB family protein